MQRTPSRDHLGWFVAGGLTALGWAAFVAYGYGDLGSPLALAGPTLLGVHAVFAAAAVACLLRGQALRWEAQRTPYPEGTYLFPAAVIAARRAQLVEHDLTELRAVQVEGSRVRLDFAGSAGFAFDAGSAELAARAKAALEAHREQWTRVQGEDAQREQARLSPLVDSGVPNPLAPTTPLLGQRFLKPGAFALITVVAAAMLSWAVWWWRNALSEKALYARATAQNDVEAYEAFLARGGRSPEVAEILLPRARLNAARAAGSVEAIRHYMATHPETKIGPEIQEALRAALLGELDKAKAQGTVTALAEFAQKHPDHTLVSEEVAAARRAVYQRVLGDFEKGAAPKSGELVPFVRRLLAHVEKHGPRVDVRMEHRFPQKLETLDNILAKSPKYYMGRRSLPTQYFLGEYAAKRETALAERLIARLQTSFPKDVLELRFVGPSAEINEKLPPPEVPTLTIQHVQNLSGGFVGGKPKTIFLGASIGITATFELPGQDQPFVFKWGKWAPPGVRKADEADKMVPDIVPDVYEDMVGGAFQKFADEYLSLWYAAP